MVCFKVCICCILRMESLSNQVAQGLAAVTKFIGHIDLRV